LLDLFKYKGAEKIGSYPVIIHNW